MAELSAMSPVGWVLALLALFYLGYQWFRGMSHEPPR